MLKKTPNDAALAALPAPQLLLLLEQTRSLGHFMRSYPICWHFMGKRFIFPTLLDPAHSELKHDDALIHLTLPCVQ